MPIYEYRCPKCKANFELRRSIAEMDEPAMCPECGTGAKRVITGSAFEHTKTWQMYVEPDKTKRTDLC